MRNCHYALVITMRGDIDCRANQTLDMYYRRPSIAWDDIHYTQDFTALKGAKPTKFKTFAGAEKTRVHLEKVCKRIQSQLFNNGIRRTLDVSIVVVP